MAKKKPTSRTDAVRQAVDQAFQQSPIPRERISELLDELGHTAGRLRSTVDELRPASAEELKSLKAEVDALTKRVATLEAAAKPKPAPRRPAAKRTTAASAAKPATAAKPRKTAAAKPKPATGS